MVESTTSVPSGSVPAAFNRSERAIERPASVVTFDPADDEKEWQI